MIKEYPLKEIVCQNRYVQGLLITLGDKVADAAKEGPFPGFVGERVGEHERTLLAELAEAVGVLQA